MEKEPTGPSHRVLVCVRVCVRAHARGKASICCSKGYPS